MICEAYNTQKDFVARVLLAAIFFMGGVGKLTDSAGTIAYMEAYRVPMADVLVYVAAIFLIVASIALVAGYKRCITAGLLFAYTALVTVIFHFDLSDQMQVTMMLKNLAIMGGLLMVVASCHGRCGFGKKDAGSDHDHSHGSEDHSHSHE